MQVPQQIHTVLGEGHRRRVCKPDPEQTEVVKTWQAPKDAAQLSSFLGFANYYREFIKGYADIAAPLSRLNRKNAAWQWGEEEQFAFDALKKMLTSAPVTGLPTDEGMFILDTDASTVAIAGVLSQNQESSGQVREVPLRTRAEP